MPPLAVVPDLNISEHRRSRFGTSGEAMPIHTLALECRKEAFGGRVVPTVAFTAHTALDPSLLERLLIIVTGVLTATITLSPSAGS